MLREETGFAEEKLEISWLSCCNCFKVIWMQSVVQKALLALELPEWHLSFGICMCHLFSSLMEQCYWQQSMKSEAT